MARVVRLLLTVVVAACSAGCPPQRPRPDAGQAPPAPVPAYRDLVARHNRAIADIQQIWAFAIVSLKWTEDGKTRREQGEGQLAIVLPDRLSLTIGKVHDLFRIGCDADRYWIIDLSADQTIAHVGRVDQAATTSRRELHTVVQPQHLIRLLGLLPIDPLREPPAPAVVRHGRHLLIDPPGTRVRMLLDAATARPVRIDLLDDAGFSRITATLGRYDHLETTGRPPGSWPRIATQFEIHDLETDSVVKLSLAEAVGDAGAINARWFDLETLIDALEADVNDLDRP